MSQRRSALLGIAAFLIAAGLASCGADADPARDVDALTVDDVDEVRGDIIIGDTNDGTKLALVSVTRELRAPSGMAVAPGDERIYVTGIDRDQVVIVEGTRVTDVFLDLKDHLARNGDGDERGRGERGLLALAFHPNYESNGRFFVWYADRSGVAELVEYRRGDDADRADPASGTVLISLERGPDHFGSQLHFGPEGYLWLAPGDGGSGQTANDPADLRGKILRLDVSEPGVASPAPDNPFIDSVDAAPEVWALGLRNPWRFTIDHPTRTLIVGDVGLETAEEISRVSLDAPGPDFGWPILEGTACNRTESRCSDPSLQPPAIEILHPDGCSVISGPVYRGNAIPSLDGQFFFSDFCGGYLRSAALEGDGFGEVRQWVEQIGPVTSFGVDHDGEIYVLTIDGHLRKLVPLAA